MYATRLYTPGESIELGHTSMRGSIQSKRFVACYIKFKDALGEWAEVLTHRDAVEISPITCTHQCYLVSYLCQIQPRFD